MLAAGLPPQVSHETHECLYELPLSMRTMPTGPQSLSKRAASPRPGEVNHLHA
jgi:hypothetical protein